MNNSQDLQLAITAMSNGDNSVLEQYLDKNEELNRNDLMHLITKIVKSDNAEALSLLSTKSHPNNKELLMQWTRLQSITYGLQVLKDNKDYFLNSHEMNDVEADPSHNIDTPLMFGKENSLDRYYEPMTFNTDWEVFSNAMLVDLLAICLLREKDWKNFEELIKDRKDFHIKDEFIIQALIELNYSFVAANSNIANNPVKVNELKENFVRIMQTLYNEGVSFKSDTQGYLIQIALVNNVDEVIPLLIDNGSNVNKFLERFNNKENWLTPEEEKALYKKYTEYRQYNIYKKFDSQNSFSEDSIKAYCRIKNHLDLDNKIPNKEEVSTPKLKI